MVMKVFYLKIFFHSTFKKTFLMRIISGIPLPRRVHHASGILANPPTLKFGRHLFTTPHYFLWRGQVNGAGGGVA